MAILKHPTLMILRGRVCKPTQIILFPPKMKHHTPLPKEWVPITFPSPKHVIRARARFPKARGEPNEPLNGQYLQSIPKKYSLYFFPGVSPNSPLTCYIIHCVHRVLFCWCSIVKMKFFLKIYLSFLIPNYIPPKTNP